MQSKKLDAMHCLILLLAVFHCFRLTFALPDALEAYNIKIADLFQKYYNDGYFYKVLLLMLS
jgi:hypothetical protein